MTDTDITIRRTRASQVLASLNAPNASEPASTDGCGDDRCELDAPYAPDTPQEDGTYPEQPSPWAQHTSVISLHDVRRDRFERADPVWASEHIRLAIRPRDLPPRLATGDLLTELAAGAILELGADGVLLPEMANFIGCSPARLRGCEDDVLKNALSIATAAAMIFWEDMARDVECRADAHANGEDVAGAEGMTPEAWAIARSVVHRQLEDAYLYAAAGETS